MIDSLKICAIHNENKSGTGVIGYVLYHANEKEFSIELDERLSLSDVPIFFDAFIQKKMFTITDHFARKWVDQRIVPKNRQNLGMILKEAGLTEYDPYALLLWGGGRSSQDDCYIIRSDEKNVIFPGWFTKRLDEKIMYLCPLSGERALVSLKNGMLYLIGLNNPKSAYISAGGNAILNRGKPILKNTEIKEKGKETQRKRTNAEKKNVVHRKRHHPKTFLHKDVGLQMENDCNKPNLTIEQIVQKYSSMYRVRFETTLKQLSAEYPFIPYQEGYLKIYFRSEWMTDHVGKRVNRIKPFRNGEWRHVMLLNQLILVIAMNYDRICYDDLLFHGLYLFSIGYENKNLDGTDCVGADVFTPKRIKSIVDDAWSEDLNYRYKMIEKAKKESEYGFKVNPDTACMLNMSKRELLPLVKWFYTRCVWIKRIQLIEQDILMGKTYKELAKILSEKLGKDIKPSTLGTHIREWRKNSEKMNLGDKNVTKNWQNPFSTSNSTQNPVYTTSPITPYTPIKRENILSKTNNMTPQDLGITEKHYYELTVFMEYYDNNKTNTENHQYMKSQGLKMSESTYKRNKRLMNKIKNIEEQRHYTI